MGSWDWGETYGRHDSSNKAAPSREDGEETNDKLDSREHNRDDKSPVHPASSLLVRVHAAVVFIAEHLLDVGAVHAPDSEGIEVELELARGAVCDSLFAGLRILLALAVGEEADLVEVLEFLGVHLASEGVEEFLRGVGCDAVGYLVQKVLGVLD